MPRPLTLEKHFTELASKGRAFFVHGENSQLYPEGEGRTSACWGGTIKGKYLLNAYCVQELTQFSTRGGEVCLICI